MTTNEEIAAEFKHLASKAELANLRAEMHQQFAAMHEQVAALTKAMWLAQLSMAAMIIAAAAVLKIW